MGVFQLMLIISLSAVSRAHRCSDPWKEIGGDCWRFFVFEDAIQNLQNSTWNNAKHACQRKGAVLAYPRTNAAIEDIVREADLADIGIWRHMFIGLHSTTGVKGPYVVLENGTEPNEKIPWRYLFPVFHDESRTCVLLKVGNDTTNYVYPGLMVNIDCDHHKFRSGYACKDLRTTTMTAPPTLSPQPTQRPTTSTQGVTRSQESSTTGSVPRITDTTTTAAEIPYVLILAVVGGLVGALVTTGMCFGSAVVQHFFPDKDEADTASLDSKGEKKTEDSTSGSDEDSDT